MRIIGGKDYYDSARSLGEDNNTVFIRHKDNAENYQKIESIDYLGKIPPSRSDISRASMIAREFAIINVIFAGVMYVGIQHTSTNFKKTTVWNYDDALELSEKTKLSFQFGSKKYRWHSESLSDFKSMFEPWKISQRFLDTLIERGISIAIYDGSETRKNNMWKINTDGLHKYNFVKVINPYQAFQELSMWVGGVLPQPSKPIVEIKDEKVMLAKHSMDKWSFRKPSAQIHKKET